MITDEQLAEWRRLADAAWPGPWELELDRNDQQNVYAADRTWIALLPHQCVRSIEEERERDAEFIAAARAAVPALIAEVERLRGEQNRAVDPSCFFCAKRAGDGLAGRCEDCAALEGA